MKFIIFFLVVGLPFVYSELHMFITTYTGINRQTAAGTPEFSSVTRLDYQQIDYNDSDRKKLIPKQDWMRELAYKELWKEYIEMREKLLQIYKNNIHVLMETFTQSHGVHTYQRMYGCEWDDETGDSKGFDQYGYDGEDFISLDLKENRYITSVPHASPTVKKWNNDREQLTSLKQYYDHECVYWLKEFLHLSKDTFEKADPPKVSLLQKKQDYYVECHVTGFLFRNTSILWMKNGQAINHSSNLVESGDTLPNEDGTFQKTLTLYVLPEERRDDEYSCVVEHKSLTETIQKSLTVNKIKMNKSASEASFIIYLVPVIILVIVLIVLWKRRMKPKARSKHIRYRKTQSWHTEQAQDQESLLSTHSHKRSSSLEDSDS